MHKFFIAKMTKCGNGFFSSFFLNLVEKQLVNGLLIILTPYHFVLQMFIVVVLHHLPLFFLRSTPTRMQTHITFVIEWYKWIYRNTLHAALLKIYSQTTNQNHQCGKRSGRQICWRIYYEGKNSFLLYIWRSAKYRIHTHTHCGALQPKCILVVNSFW